ncbi:MAG: sigma-70 family RNA polymerase sigma factor [Chitinophagaceae bacterium]
MERFFDRDIINDLLQGGIDRKKGEEQLFNQFAYFIEQAMRKYSFPEEEAFNIYADTIIAAITKITNRSFEGRSSLKTWLFQIFHNKCVDLVRKKTTNKNIVHRALSVPDMLLQMADTAKSVIQEMMEKTDKDQLQQVLKKIGENCQRILLQWGEGYSDKEIAVVMEYKNADVVKTSRLRCIEKLKQLYKTV